MIWSGVWCGEKAVCKWDEECSMCGQNKCNTYTCDYQTPTCVEDCAVPEPKCVCRAKFHRKSPTGKCVPLQC